MIDINKLFKRSLELYFAYSFSDKYNTIDTADFCRVMCAVKKAITEQEKEDQFVEKMKNVKEALYGEEVEIDMIEEIKNDMYKRML